MQMVVSFIGSRYVEHTPEATVGTTVLTTVLATQGPGYESWQQELQRRRGLRSGLRNDDLREHSPMQHGSNVSRSVWLRFPIYLD